MKINITDYMPSGNENRITSKEITRFTGFSGADIRCEVNKLRSEGVPIASDKYGYYIATNADELEHTIRQLKHRIAMITTACEGLIEAQKEMRE